MIRGSIGKNFMMLAALMGGAPMAGGTTGAKSIEQQVKHTPQSNDSFDAPFNFKRGGNWVLTGGQNSRVFQNQRQKRKQWRQNPSSRPKHNRR